MSFATAVLQKMLREAREQPPPPDDDTDVLFLVGGDGDRPQAALRAHRLVLAAVSPVFHEWFRADAGAASYSSSTPARTSTTTVPPPPPPLPLSPEERAAEALSAIAGRRRNRRDSVITVRLQDFPPNVVEAALDVVYGGVFVDSDDWTLAGQCWDFAVRFQIPHLGEVARKRALRKLDASNALNLLAYALAVEDERAIDQVADFIGLEENFAHIIQSAEFPHVDGPLLDALVRPRAGSLVPGQSTTVEKVWFDALMTWLRVPDERAVARQNHDDRTSAGTSRSAGNQPKKLTPPSFPRMRHVDHVLTLVDFNRMLTDELAVVAEDVTACHGAAFPHCLIPILSERAIFLGREQSRRIKEISDLGKAFECAVYAKNEAERGRRVIETRLEQTLEEVRMLREALKESNRRARSPPSVQLTGEQRFSDPPDQEREDARIGVAEEPRPRPFYGAQDSQPLISATPHPRDVIPGRGTGRMGSSSPERRSAVRHARTFEQERRLELGHMGLVEAEGNGNTNDELESERRRAQHGYRNLRDGYSAHDGNRGHAALRDPSPVTWEDVTSPIPRGESSVGSPLEDDGRAVHSEEERRSHRHSSRTPPRPPSRSQFHANAARHSSLPNIQRRHTQTRDPRVRRRVRVEDGRLSVPPRPPLPLPQIQMLPQRMALERA